jgi:hypothetical protein
MTWQRAKLEAVIGARLDARGRLRPVEEAALAYARWQGLTDEPDVDGETAKAQLDRSLEALDELGPSGWSDVAKLADDLGDAAIIGLMAYSLEQSGNQVRDPSIGIGQAKGMGTQKSKGKGKSKGKSTSL